MAYTEIAARGPSPHLTSNFHNGKKGKQVLSFSLYCHYADFIQKEKKGGDRERGSRPAKKKKKKITAKEKPSRAKVEPEHWVILRRDHTLEITAWGEGGEGGVDVKKD